MGCNYYYHKPDTNHCEYCGRFNAGEIIHIGKSSAGWCFVLHVTDEIRSLEDWKREWASGGNIVDQYGEQVTPAEMLSIITERRCEQGPKLYNGTDWGEYHQPGPNGLLRARIGRACIAHGEGTWDLKEGEFS